MSTCKAGIIQDITGDVITIKISRSEACGDCQIKNYCHNNAEQMIKINCSNAADWHIKDKVNLYLSDGWLLKSVFWCYILPLWVMLGAIVCGFAITKSEIVGGISGIIILIMYYFGLFLGNKFFAKQIKYEIKPIKSERDNND